MPTVLLTARIPAPQAPPPGLVADRWDPPATPVAPITHPEQLPVRTADTLYLSFTPDSPDILQWAPALGQQLLDHRPQVLSVGCHPHDPQLLAHWLTQLQALLLSLDLATAGYRLVCCPTCARCKTDLPALARQVEQGLQALPRPPRPICVAVMGCEVNGPGEARAADVGVAWGGQHGRLFRAGQALRKIQADELVEALLAEVVQLTTLE